MKFNKIGFIGLGLIGGSIAKKMKESQPHIHIIATAGHIETIAEAHSMGLIENEHLLALQDFSECDIIFLLSKIFSHERGFLEYNTAMCSIIYRINDI